MWLITRVWGGRVVKVVLRLHSLKAETVVSEHGLKEAVCCIYHAPKGIDESSDESSSDSSSDSDSGDDGSARPARRQAGMDIITITTTIMGREKGKGRDERGVRMRMKRYPSLRVGLPRIRART
jgi:hypothetical protein